MTKIPVLATSFKVDIKNNHIIYETNIKDGADTGLRSGIVVLNDPTGTYDLMLTDQIYEGTGPLILRMKPIKYPGAKKFEVGEQIASLILV